MFLILYRYYHELHALLPILPDSKRSLNAMMGNVRPQFQAYLCSAVEAFFTALQSGTTNSSAFYSAHELLFNAQQEAIGHRSELENLVLLQGSIILAMAKEVSGPGLNDTIPSYSFAWDIANHFGLHLNREINAQDRANDASVKLNQRRCWLILVTLDRWHSAGMVKPAKIHEEDFVLHPSDRQILGETAYQMICKRLLFLVLFRC